VLDRQQVVDDREAAAVPRVAEAAVVDADEVDEDREGERLAVAQRLRDVGQAKGGVL